MKIFLIPAILCMLKINAPNGNASAAAAASSSSSSTATASTSSSSISTTISDPYMFIKGAPLGGVWPSNLPTNMIQFQIDAAKDEIKKNEKETNFATFQLGIAMNNGNLIELLTPVGQDRFFSSGGYMLVNCETQELESASQKRTELETKVNDEELQIAPNIEMKKKEAGKDFSAALNLVANSKRNSEEEIHHACTNMRDRLLEIQKLRLTKSSQEKKQYEEKEKEYLQQVKKIIQQMDAGAVYDSEQTIIRIINHYIEKKLLLDDEYLKIVNNDTKKFAIKDINYIVLNLYTRLDMCPFCLLYLAHSFKDWRKKLNNIPFLVIVCSRDHYRCPYSFITEQPYYNGWTMRSIGQLRRQREDEKSNSASATSAAAASSNAKNNNENSQFSNNQEAYTLDELKKIAAKGAVIQYALPAHLIYDTIYLDAFLS